MRLCAGRSAQEVNLSALGADAGISQPTARAWLSVLEASFVLHRLPAWRINLRKQIVKAPKLHLFDSGLLCHLLGVRDPAQLALHPLRGAVFESWVVSEIYKTIAHAGRRPNLFHYRESRGIEVDLLIEEGMRIDAVESKSGATIASDFFDNLRRFSERLTNASQTYEVNGYLIYGGSSSQQRSDVSVLRWQDVDRIATG